MQYLFGIQANLGFRKPNNRRVIVMFENDSRWREIRNIHAEYAFFYQLSASALVLIIGILIGFAIFPSDNGYKANLYTSILSVVVTVLVIDRLNERRAKKQLINQLILNLASPDNSIALHALWELQKRDLLGDGSLNGAMLFGANLKGAVFYWYKQERDPDGDGYSIGMEHAQLRNVILTGANLQEAELTWCDLGGSDLSRTNLKIAQLFMTNLNHADLSDADLENANLYKVRLKEANLSGAKNVVNEQLVTADILRKAVLPDGSIYDGRFNLDIELGTARRNGYVPENPQSMADYYGISIDDYKIGQEWAQKYLSDLREKSKLWNKEREKLFVGFRPGWMPDT